MAPPLLAHSDLHGHPWKGRSSSCFRLPRRSRRATWICSALIALLFYLTLNSITKWPANSSGPYFDRRPVDPEHIIPISFPHLYATLSRVTGGSLKSRNTNVLFSAGSLEAASKLAGIACEMATYQRSNIHFALLGSDSIDVRDFKKINGISNAADGCRIYFHDARANDAKLMSEERRKAAVGNALRHLNDFIHPRAMLLDVEHEEKWLMGIVREKTKQLGLVTIELPKNAVDDLRWITRLDSASLSAWHKPSLEILIHADKHSGNLERLLTSIESANYPSKSHVPTRITILLDPATLLHAFTKKFLSTYSFPSRSAISVRRPLTSPSADESAIRTVESFYPVGEDTSLLILNANVELSQFYFHYLLYATLEYRYSGYRNFELLGISLEEPSVYLNGTSFPPRKVPAPFLYSAPNSRAALYFPQHWAEFHSYFSYTLPSPSRKNITASPLLPEIASSWLYPLIALTRIRGYVMLYPSFPGTSLAIFHDEDTNISALSAKKKEKPLMQKNTLLDDLPDSDLPAWKDLEILDLDGDEVSWGKLEMKAIETSRATSNCSSLVVVEPYTVGDLFCDDEGNKIEL